MKALLVPLFVTGAFAASCVASIYLAIWLHSNEFGATVVVSGVLAMFSGIGVGALTDA